MDPLSLPHLCGILGRVALLLELCLLAASIYCLRGQLFSPDYVLYEPLPRTTYNPGVSFPPVNNSLPVQSLP